MLCTEIEKISTNLHVESKINYSKYLIVFVLMFMRLMENLRKLIRVLPAIDYRMGCDGKIDALGVEDLPPPRWRSRGEDHPTCRRRDAIRRCIKLRYAGSGTMVLFLVTAPMGNQHRRGGWKFGKFPCKSIN
jgi:hypothetical protein